MPEENTVNENGLGEKGQRALDAMKQRVKDLEKLNKTLTSRVGQYEDISPEQIDDLKQQLISKDREVEQLKSSYDKRLKEAEEQRDSSLKLYNDSIVESTLAKAYLEAGGLESVNGESVFDMIKPGLVAKLSIKDGKPIYTKDGKDLGAQDLIKEFKAGAGSAVFKSEMGAGSGRMTVSRPPTDTRVNVLDMSPRERLEYGRENGLFGSGATKNG